MQAQQEAATPHAIPPATRTLVGGFAFDNVTMPEAVARILQMAQKTDFPRIVCTGNLDHLATLQRDAEFRAVYAVADLTLADGAPVVWLSRLAGTPLKERVAGSDLFWELAHASSVTGLRLFFLGGADSADGEACAAQKAADAVAARYPGAVVCGWDCPSHAKFATPEEQQRIWKVVRDARPDVLLVAFGAPKQEKWIAAHKELLGVPVLIGVGGTFEMAAGIVRRAPVWMQRSGLEWAFRFAQEPGRLWKRYFASNLPLLGKLAAQTVMSRLRGSRATEA